MRAHSGTDSFSPSQTHLHTHSQSVWVKSSVSSTSVLEIHLPDILPTAISQPGAPVTHWPQRSEKGGGERTDTKREAGEEKEKSSLSVILVLKLGLRFFKQILPFWYPRINSALSRVILYFRADKKGFTLLLLKLLLWRTVLSLQQKHYINFLVINFKLINKHTTVNMQLSLKEGFSHLDQFQVHVTCF